MALVVFLRGVNVGGHKTFRPAAVAKALSKYDVVNVGAAGTFVVRKPGSRAQFQAALAKQLPFETNIMVCDGKDILHLESSNPFDADSARPDMVRFVSVLSKAGGAKQVAPMALPPDGDWLVRVLEARKQFVFGVYRRHMKTISYLGQLDRVFGGEATTRNWNTMNAIMRILKSEHESPRGGSAGARRRKVK